ncbi:MAG TPA: 2-dehydropantoate 2-reductase [Candidatus Binataceae bacterium]|jgi:2-dehydropantoate 2-reductase|nr:2-dehydropantoate 2-reductase [Candidatus Binataceae bacterium]
MKILIMGAGGVGAYFGARLQQAGEDVVFAARGENLRAMREYGLEIQSYKGDFKLAVSATDDPGEFAPYDLVLFAVKSYDTEAGAKQLVGTLAPDGILMTIQNGVENEEILCRYFPREAVMGGNSRVGAELIAPGKVMHTAIGVIEFGELDGRITPRAERLMEIFKRAGIFGELTTDLKTIRWYKLMGNNGTNPVCALSLSSIGQILGDDDGYELSRTLMAEAIAVGKAEGAKVTEDRIEMQLQGIKNNRNAFKIKPSTLQDLEKGKRLEHDAICGAVVRAAARHNIPVPATKAMFALLKMIDARMQER